MADIAFLLFIFFAVSTSFDKDVGIDLVLPATRTPEQMPRRQVTVAIDREGKLFINGKELAAKSSVGKHIQDMLAGVKPENREVVFRCHREIKKEVFEPVIFAVSEAGTKLIMSTEPGSEWQHR